MIETRYFLYKSEYKAGWGKFARDLAVNGSKSFCSWGRPVFLEGVSSLC